jgi:hypothetical protein
MTATRSIVRTLEVADRRTDTRTSLLARIGQRVRDYVIADGTRKLVAWGRLMGLVEAGAIHGYWPVQITQRVAEMLWERPSASRVVRMLDRSMPSGTDVSPRR